MDRSGGSLEPNSAEIPRGTSRRAERARLAEIARRFGSEARGTAVALAALIEARRHDPSLPDLPSIATGHASFPTPFALSEPPLRLALRARSGQASAASRNAKGFDSLRSLNPNGKRVRAIAAALAKAIAWDAEADPAGRVLQEFRAAEDRHSHGAFYTPEGIVAQALDALGPLEGKRVLDPACGSGAFLVEAARRGARVDGADLDAEAVAVARFRLAWRGADVGEIVSGSALDALPDVAWDAVIGNPPYVRFHELDAATRSSLASRFETCVGQFDLFAPFLERALDVVKPGGRVVFVLPALLLRGARYATLRKFLLSRANVEQVIDHGDGAFEGVLAPTCILVLHRLPSHGRRREKTSDVFSRRVRAIREKTSDVFSPQAVRWTRPDGARVDVDEKLWRDDPNSAFAPIGEEDARFLAALERFPRLEEIAHLGRGVEIGRDHPALGTRGIPCVTGSDLCRGEAWPAKLLDVAKLDAKLRPDDRDLAARVLVRETGERLIAACVARGVASTRSVFHVIPRELPLEYVLAWISSSHAQRWFELCVRAESGIFPKLRIGQLGSLHIPVEPALIVRVLALGRDEAAIDAAFAAHGNFRSR